MATSDDEERRIQRNGQYGVSKLGGGAYQVVKEGRPDDWCDVGKPLVSEATALRERDRLASLSQRERVEVHLGDIDPLVGLHMVRPSEPGEGDDEFTIHLVAADHLTEAEDVGLCGRVVHDGHEVGGNNVTISDLCFDCWRTLGALLRHPSGGEA